MRAFRRQTGRKESGIVGTVDSPERLCNGDGRNPAVNNVAPPKIGPERSLLGDAKGDGVLMRY